MVTPHWGSGWYLVTSHWGRRFCSSHWGSGVHGSSPLGERWMFWFTPRRKSGWVIWLLLAGGEGGLCSSLWRTGFQGNFPLGEKVGYLFTPRWGRGFCSSRWGSGVHFCPHWWRGWLVSFTPYWGRELRSKLVFSYFGICFASFCSDFEKFIHSFSSLKILVKLPPFYYATFFIFTQEIQFRNIPGRS